MLGVGAALSCAVLVAAVSLLSAPVNAVPTLPAGFRNEVVLDGLTNPTNVEFSRDGRVFVAQKSGLIRVLDNLSDTTPDWGPKATSSVRLDPKTVRLRFASRPTGVRLVVGSGGTRAPFSRAVMVGASNSVSSPSRHVLEGKTHHFRGWSDGGARTHNIIAPATETTYRATFGVRRR
jgi:hypothetical protein